MKEVKTYLAVCICIGVGFIKLELDKENLEMFQLVLCMIVGVIGGIYGLNHMLKARKRMSMGAYCLPLLGGVILTLASLASCNREEKKEDIYSPYYKISIIKKEKKNEEYLVHYSRDLGVNLVEPDTFIAKVSMAEFQKYHPGETLKMRDTLYGEPLHKPNCEVYEYRIDGKWSRMGYSVGCFGPKRRYYKLSYRSHKWPHGKWSVREEFNASQAAYSAHSAGKCYRERNLPEYEGLVW